EAGSYTNTWVVTDACGNVSATYTQTITIIDTTPPTWTTVAGALDVTLECSDLAGLAAAQAMIPVATDNCDGDVTNIVKTTGLYVPGLLCPEAGSYTNTWVVTDACGNVSATYTQTITIIDTTPPTFTVPTETTICRDLSGNYDRDPSNTGDVIDEADNCSTGLNAIYGDSDAAMGTFTAVGYITRTWTLTDNCGNTTVQTQTIWVQPIPNISVEVPDTLYCNGSTINFTIDSLVVSRGEVMYNLDVTYPAGVTGLLSDGPNQIMNISDQLTNATDIHQTVTYKFMPYIQGKTGDPTCFNGRDTTIVIHIEPTAKVVPSIVNDVLCNAELVSITWTSPTTPYAGKEFNIIVINDYPEITGYSNQTGLTTSDNITEALSNSGDTARMIQYVIIPVLLDIGGNQKCPGINDTVNVWVNPTPRVYPIATSQICYGAPTNIRLTSPTVMTSGVIWFDYTITASALPVVVNGNRLPANDQPPGTVLAFPYTNESDTIQTVSFHITPKVFGGPACLNGPIVTTNVRVHAIPLQDLMISDSITCDGGGNGSLEVITSKGAAPYYIKWTGPFGYNREGYDLRVIDNLLAGLYRAVVIDSLRCQEPPTSLNLTDPQTDASFYSPLKAPAYDYHITCPGANDAQIFLAVTEGEAPPYSYVIIRNLADTLYIGSFPGLYEISDPATSRIIPGVMPGEYLLVVKDANGCPLPRLLEISEPPPVSVTFDASDYNGYNISCKSYDDGSAWVKTITGGSRPYTYSWTTSDGLIPGAANDSIIVNLTVGTYDLVVTDAMGCISAVFSITLTEPDGIDLLSLPVFSQSPDGNYNISCFGRNDGSINLEFNDAYSYTWTGPSAFTATTEDISGLVAGDYHLLVNSNNGCQRNYYYTLNEPDSVGMVVMRSSTGDGLYNINCNGENGSIDITVTGGSVGSYNYSWKDNSDPSWTSTLEDQLAIKAGSYRVYVTDANGCTIDRGVSLTQPLPLEVAINVSHLTCLTAPVYNDGSIDLTVSGGGLPYAYSWTGPGGFVASTQDISGLSMGDYGVIVTDNYGCILSIDTVINMPEPLSIEKTMSDYNGFNISCLGRSDGWLQVTPLTGVAPYSYSWTGPAGFTALTESISGLAAGTYTVTITDANMCTLTDITILASPGQISMSFVKGLSNAGSYNINCNGSSTGEVDITAINAAGASAFLWSDGGSGVSRNDLKAGDYEVIITDANGCSADTTLSITQPDSLLMTFTSVKPYCSESPDGSISAVVTGGEPDYIYLWNEGTIVPDITGLTAGVYILTATDANGCLVTDSLTLDPSHNLCVGIPNAFSPNNDGINDYWNINRMDFYPASEVIIMNRWGEMVWKSGKGYPEPWDGRASNGKVLPVDSYHYAIDLHNGEKPIVGHVTIVK
ncbi:MAG TPA: gliding motility-associated C-terminal domain-containing protein, partial [Bacteroidales bacterium]|nr:gliding motility-associated C-terminal domain-containing protein [Bacteroidales bacterium]